MTKWCKVVQEVVKTSKWMQEYPRVLVTQDQASLSTLLNYQTLAPLAPQPMGVYGGGARGLPKYY